MAVKVGLVAKLDDEDALETATRLAKRLRSSGVIVQAELELAKKARIGGGKELSELECDLMVTIGGDGTVLKTCMTMPKPETPILAVNMGRRGYLTEVEPEKAEWAVKAFMRGRFTADKRAKISISEGGRHIADALNEFVISSGSPSKMVDLRLMVDSTELLKLRGDGVILATATGSTAYSLSAGGPFLDPTVNALLVTFICPLEFVRPIVLSLDRSIKVEVAHGKHKAILMADGRIQRQVQAETELSVTRSNHLAVFVRFGATPSIGNLMRLKEPTRKI